MPWTKLTSVRSASEKVVTDELVAGPSEGRRWRIDRAGEADRGELAGEAAIDELGVRREPFVEPGMVEHASLEASNRRRRSVKIGPSEDAVAVGRPGHGAEGGGIGDPRAAEVAALEQRGRCQEDRDQLAGQVDIDDHGVSEDEAVGRVEALALDAAADEPWPGAAGKLRRHLPSQPGLQFFQIGSPGRGVIRLGPQIE